MLTIGAAVVFGACSGSSGSSGAKPPAAGPPNLVTIVTTTAQRPVVDRLGATFTQLYPGLQVAAKNDTPAGINSAITNGGAQVVIAPKAFLGGHDDQTMGRSLAVVAVPAENPARVTGLTAFGLGSPLRTRICGAPTVIGNFMLFVFNRAKVVPNPANVNNDPGCPVTALADLAAGRLDAVAMFRNNATIVPSVKLINVPTAQNLIIDYGAAILGDAPATAKFREFLGSDRAKEVLTQSGYLP